MHDERLRTRGVALVLTMVVVVVAGAGGGLAVADFGPADTQVQSDNATDGEDDESAEDSGGDEATESPTEADKTPSPDPDGTDPGDAVAASAEAATATETPPSTDTPTSTPESDGVADTEETASSDGATAENETATEATNPTEGENGTTNESDASMAGSLASCTEIDEPGQYELSADVSGGSGACLAVQSSDVVLDGNGHTVAGSGSGTGIQVSGDLSNVTVRNVDVSDWRVAVELGGSGASGPQANLVEVRATGSDTGVRMIEADDSAMQAVTARDNGDGVVLVDTASVQASDVTVDGNAGTGLWLARGVSDSSFSIVRATANGDQGIHVATGAVNNFIGDATVTDNGGPGVEFADSSNNVLADSRVEENGGPGVLSYPAVGDRLENVELSGNGDGAYRDRAEVAGAVADTVQLRDGVSVQFDQGVTHLASVGSPESLPDGTDAAGPAVDVALRDGDDATATVTVPVDASGDVTTYQRVDGNWQELTDATVTNGEAEIPVSRSGVVVPVVETTDDESTETGTDGDTVRADTSSNEELAASEEQATGADADDSGAADDQYAVGGGRVDDGTADTSANQIEDRAHTLVIGPAAADATINYTLRIDGNVSKVTDGNVSADANDTISRTNGTVKVTGTTDTVDAYLVDGQLRQVRETVGTPGYFLRYGATIGGNETQP